MIVNSWHIHTLIPWVTWFLHLLSHCSLLHLRYCLHPPCPALAPTQILLWHCNSMSYLTSQGPCAVLVHFLNPNTTVSVWIILTIWWERIFFFNLHPQHFNMFSMRNRNGIMVLHSKHKYMLFLKYPLINMCLWCSLIFRRWH